MGESQSDINMTPLIDVMLVLLVIFIITIPMQTNAIKIDNPRASAEPTVVRHDISPKFTLPSTNSHDTKSWHGRWLTCSAAV